MPRIANVEIPDNKKIRISLTYIYGIGPFFAGKILKQAKIDPETKTSTLKEEDLSRLRGVVQESYKTEGALREEVRGNIKRLKTIHSYRGIRHEKRLPVRGQNTQTNTRTVRGRKKVTIATGQKKAVAKT